MKLNKGQGYQMLTPKDLFVAPSDSIWSPITPVKSIKIFLNGLHLSFYVNFQIFWFPHLGNNPSAGCCFPLEEFRVAPLLQIEI
jgi:hypothetical protein